MGDYTPPSTLVPAIERRVQPDGSGGIRPSAPITPVPAQEIIDNARKGYYGGTNGDVVHSVTTRAAGSEILTPQKLGRDVIAEVPISSAAIRQIDGLHGSNRSYVGAQSSSLPLSEKAGYRDVVLSGGIKVGVNLQIDFMEATNPPSACIDLGKAELTSNGVKAIISGEQAERLTTAPCATFSIPTFGR